MNDRARSVRTAGDLALPAALLHPLRLQILSFINERGCASATEIARACTKPRSSISEQVRRLRAEGLLSLVEAQDRRGAREMFYACTDQVPVLGKSETEDLPVRIKKRIALTLVRGFSSSVTSALASPWRSIQDDSCWSSTTLRVDLRGWRELSEMHQRASAEIERVRVECHGRVGGGATDALIAASSMFLYEV
jgi:DNA-binding transcriptional ArsR family regulator